MIVDLPDTTTSAISTALVKVREEGGAVALGRVRTLVIASAGATDEEAIEAANEASREHPMRVIVLSAVAGEPRLGTNGGTRAGLVGSHDQVADRIAAFAEAGIELFMLQFQPLEAEAPPGRIPVAGARLHAVRHMDRPRAPIRGPAGQPA